MRCRVRTIAQLGPDEQEVRDKRGPSLVRAWPERRGTLGARSLVLQVLTETKQNVPGWLPNYAARSPGYGTKSRRGGGRFGGRDFRKDGGYGEQLEGF